MATIVYHGESCSWRQRGDFTGHCSGRECHRTFDTLKAFDRHQTVDDGKVTCHDPAMMTRGDGSPLYESRSDELTTYWALRPTEAEREAHARFLASVRR